MTRATATALLMVALVACGVPTENTARLEDEDVPFGLLDPPPTTTSSPPGPAGTDAGLQLCFLDADDDLVTVVRRVPIDATLADAVELLAAGPAPAELAAGTTTALADGALAAQVEASHGIAEVDLTRTFAADAGRRQRLAVAQVVCTLTGRPGIGQVTFTLDGEPVEVPRGDGSTTSDPVSRDDYRQMDQP